MKKIIVLIVLALLIWIGVSAFKDKQESKVEEDYKKIEKLKEACDELATSAHLGSLGSNAVTWYVFELEFIHQSENEAQAQLEKLLGEDFETSLSNGDRLFVGFLPYRNSYRIYAGEPNDENMIYPDWNYDELEKK